jgi:hypothetical protein
LPEENTYAVRVFSRGDSSLGGAEYHSVAPPMPGDDIDVHWLHGGPSAYGQMSARKVRVVSVDQDRRVIDAHLLD